MRKIPLFHGNFPIHPNDVDMIIHGADIDHPYGAGCAFNIIQNFFISINKLYSVFVLGDPILPSLG